MRYRSRTDAEAGNAVVVRLQRRPVALLTVAQLRGDEELVPRDSTRPDCGSDAGLVVVGGRGVDVPVPDLQGVLDHTLGLRRRDLEDPEAELGNLHAIVQRGRLRRGSSRAPSVPPGSPVDRCRQISRWAPGPAATPPAAEGTRRGRCRPDSTSTVRAGSNSSSPCRAVIWASSSAVGSCGEPSDFHWVWELLWSASIR